MWRSLAAAWSVAPCPSVRLFVRPSSGYSRLRFRSSHRHWSVRAELWISPLLSYRVVSCGVQDLNKLAALVRGDLGKLARGVLCALITIDVHSRDIVSEMVVQKVRYRLVLHSSPVFLFVQSLCLFMLSFVMLDYYYKIVIWVASLMSCWLLWQPVAVSIYCLRFIVFCILHSDKINMIDSWRRPTLDLRLSNGHPVDNR